MKRLLASLCCTVLGIAFVAQAKADDVEPALYRAAMLHKAGETGAALAIWLDRANRGSVDAAYNLAVIYQHGDGVALDYGKAMHWYKVAADRGDKASRIQVGLMYQIGQGVAADQEEAHRWYTMDRRQHLHHEHDPQLAAWRRQALALIEERDRRAQVAVSRSSSALVLADLQRRAGMLAEPPSAKAMLASAARLP